MADSSPNGSGRKCEPLVIIGYAARYAQDAGDTERFWEFLLQAREASTVFPEDRICSKAFYHPDPNHGGTFHAKGAHFLNESPVGFDAAFFKMSKTEVLSLDPQQRLVMENVYHALENAGISMESAISSNTSVFVNGYNHDHADNLNTDPETILKYKPTGGENSLISGRVSWFYDFRGPSITVETACSGSLVGLHLAGQSLRAGDSDMAIVSGVNVISFLPHFVGMSYSGFVGSEGKSFTFDHRADGYARGEGVGTIVVKRLADAIRDDNIIRAVIRGTGVNHDGHTPGLTYPSLSSQEQLIRKTYYAAGLDTSQTCYIESHGTGTQAGDYVEASSIRKAFDTESRDLPLFIGALKTNVGHLEGGSGIAGVIKTIKILETGIIPPNMNFEKPNPRIPIEEWNLRLPLRVTSWPTDGLRRASVSCFGLSGTNSHCILDDAHNFLQIHQVSGHHRTRVGVPTKEEIDLFSDSFYPAVNGHSTAPNNYKATNGHRTPPDHTSLAIEEAQPELVPNGHDYVDKIESTTPLKIFVISGFNEDALRKSSASLQLYLRRRRKRPDSDDRAFLGDIAYTLSKRTQFNWKICLLAGSLPQLQTQLSQDSLRPYHSRSRPTIGFVFTGQGVQYPGMGRQLLIYTVFRDALQQADEYFRGLGSGWSLLDELARGKETRINEPMLAHPASTAIQIALVELLRSWGISPHRVVGHSSGEIAAAYCAGKISREAAWKVAYFRGQVTHDSSIRPGSMMAVALPAGDLEVLLKQVRQGRPDGVLSIACFNSPKNQTVSGDHDLVNELKALLDAQRIFCRKLNVGKAYHSSHMEVFTEKYQHFMGSLETGQIDSPYPSVTMFSTYTGRLLDKSYLDPSYWCANMVGPVRFEEALRALCYDRLEDRNTSGHSAESESHLVDELLEIGAHGALRSAISGTIQSSSPISYHPTIDRNISDAGTLLRTIAELVCRGYPVNLEKVNSDSTEVGNFNRPPLLLVDLPPYPFNHDSHDIYESRLAKNLRLRQFPRHDLFGAPVPDWDPRYPRWRHFLRLNENPWLKQYKIRSEYVFPPAGYLVMAIESSMQIADHNQPVLGLQLMNVSLKTMLVIPDNTQGVEVSVSHAPIDESSPWRRFQISSYDNASAKWTEHCSGYMSVEYGEPVGGLNGSFISLSDFPGSCTAFITHEHIYKKLANCGLELGPLFRNLSDIVVSSTRRGESVSVVGVPDVKSLMPYGYMHPHLLHPTTLESILQSALISIGELHCKQDIMDVYTPTFIEYIRVSADISHEKETQFHCLATATASRNDTIYSCDVRAECASQPNAVYLKGIRFQSDNGTIKDSMASNTLTIYSVEWQPDIDFLTNSYFDCLIQTSSSSKDTYDVEKQTFMDLQLATALLATDVLFELRDLDPTGLDSHFQRFHEYLKRIAADIITDLNPGAPLHIWQKYVQRPELKYALYRKVEARDSDGALLVRVGSHIASFFRREADPLQVMFGQEELMTRYYDDDFELGSIQAKLTHLLGLIRWTKSNIRVLEIGAGTGSFTMRVLSQLCPENSQRSVTNYCFTDISSGFFEKAKKRLAQWSDVVTYKKLDVGVDPVLQGFDLGAFDLVIASNVLHATPDIRKTLSNIHSLLKPGGKLIFHEGVRQDTIWTNLSFGPLPGWWLGIEPERRWCPYVPTATWNQYLKETGFSGLDLEFPSSSYPEFSKISLMVSTAKGRDNLTPSSQASIVICAVDRGDYSLSQTLQKRIMDATDSKCCLVTLSEVAMIDLSDKIVVAMTDIAEPMLSVTASQEIHTFITNCNRLLWLTGDPKQNPIFETSRSLVRQVQREKAGDKANFLTFAIPSLGLCYESIAKSITKVLKHQFLTQGTTPSGENSDYRLENDVILTNRIVPSCEVTSCAGGLMSMTNSASVKWDEATHPRKLINHQSGEIALVYDTHNLNQMLDANSVEIEIHAVGLSDRSILGAQEGFFRIPLGEEAAGVITKVGSTVNDLQPGDRVACIININRLDGNELFTTTVQVNSSLVTRIPDSLSFEAATEIPACWLAAIYTLRNICNLAPRETILIHDGAGGKGQAAIRYAQMMGATIFTTVFSREEKQYITREYNIPADHLFLVENGSFVAPLLQKAPGGVDIVLDFSSGARFESRRCMAPFGRLVNIGPSVAQSTGVLPILNDLDNVTVTTFDQGSLVEKRPEIIREILKDIVQLWCEHKIHMQPSTQLLTYGQLNEQYQAPDLIGGFGRIVLHRSNNHIQVVSRPFQLPALEESGSYLITDMSRHTCLDIALHIARRGAKHLILVSPSSVANEPQIENMISELAEAGCSPYHFDCDLSNKAEFESLVSQWKRSFPTIKGVIHHSQVTGEGKDDSTRTLQAAITNIHTSFREVDFFVMVSAVTTDSPSFTSMFPCAVYNFEAAMARHRVSLGLHGTSLTIPTMKRQNLFAAIDYVLSDTRSGSCEIICNFPTSSSYVDHEEPIPEYFSHPVCDQLRTSQNKDVSIKTHDPHHHDPENVYQLLQNTKNDADAITIVSEEMGRKLSSLLNVSEDDIDATQDIRGNGVDSMIEMEFQGWIERELGVVIPLKDMISKSLSQLSADIVSRLAR